MISVITDAGVGGTFLTWTLYYLANKTHYYYAKSSSELKIPNNPLTAVNAHGFLPNQLNNITDVNYLLPRLIDKNEIAYMHQFRTNTKDAVDQLCKNSTKIVVLSNPSNQALYNCKYTPRTNVIKSRVNEDKLLHTPDSVYSDFVEYFFKESKQNWEKENLHNIWDKREFIALNFNPFNSDNILSYIDQSTVYHHIHTTDMWTTFDFCIKELFEYLEFDLDQSRYQSWLPVYNQWKATHYNRLRFVWYFETIINSILNGIDFDLTRFDLDIAQEAAIQHTLIYKHNLNFKTWQLVKFTNAKQLHSLLEPNIHDLTKSSIGRLTA